ncbi:MAG: helix-hairpin-helix domain-containing protein [Hyphomicrobiaceae bacterium]
MSQSTNQWIAEKLDEMAALLEVQHEDGYRVAAYRRAARAIQSLDRPIDAIARDKGIKGLVALPTIGRGIAAAIVEMVTTGRWAQLERLTGTLDPQSLFQTIPGIGPALARRIHDTLHAETLAELEQAAHDGRLADVPGVGLRRAAAVRGVLADRLGQRHLRDTAPAKTPPVGVLLDVDREYLTKAAADELRKIAPKRFNPSGDAWLPVLHARRGEWHFTVLFSNTQRAHELDRTRDWVVVYFHTDNAPEAQCTVVTETHGALAGRRVVRGREGDCIAYYASLRPAAS